MIMPQAVDASTLFELNGKTARMCSCDRSTQNDSIVRRPSSRPNLSLGLPDQKMVRMFEMAPNERNNCSLSGSSDDFLRVDCHRLNSYAVDISTIIVKALNIELKY